MAKITHGPTVSNARGKIGGAVFTRTRGGNVAKALSIAAEGVGPHNLLSTAHPDTAPATPPARGSLIVAQNVTPAWKELPLGAPTEVLTSDGTDAKWAAAAAGGVTSVGLALPAEFDVTGSPITDAGTLTGEWADQDANKILAGPISGAADTPAFRALDPTDLPILDGARVYNSADEEFASGGDNPLTFNSERYDTNALHSVAANTSRLTAKRAGVYAISAHILWASGAYAPRGLTLYLNGATPIAQEYDIIRDVGYAAQSVATLYHLDVNDYVEAFVHQNTGAALKVLASANKSPEFAMQQLTQD